VGGDPAAETGSWCVIRHLVFFTARDPADLDTMRATFATLAAIPGVRGFEVGVNTRADARTDDEPHLVVHAVFDDADALEAYKAHPIYQRSVAVVRPLRELRIAVDYEVDGAAPPPPPAAPSSP
jgi:quinol monooxygenase YgiN